MYLLEGKEVKRYFGGLKAVNGVDFHVEQGDILGLIGPNGAGKTTLFNCISGAIPLTSGTIQFNGETISGLKPNDICRKGIARTFQQVTVFANMSVLLNVTLASEYGRVEKLKSADAIEKAMDLLDFVGLKDLEKKQAHDLTLANQKRLEVARALGTNPKILLLDELIAGLNPTETEEIMELVVKIKEKGITIVMIEHVMKAIMTICNRILVLDFGEKIAEGTPLEISENEKVIEIYLGEPIKAC